MTVAETAQGISTESRCRKPLGIACHPETAKTSKDLSSGAKVTRIVHRSVVNPDATIVLALNAALCGVDFGWEIPRRPSAASE